MTANLNKNQIVYTAIPTIIEDVPSLPFRKLHFSKRTKLRRIFCFVHLHELIKQTRRCRRFIIKGKKSSRCFIHKSADKKLFKLVKAKLIRRQNSKPQRRKLNSMQSNLFPLNRFLSTLFLGKRRKLSETKLP